MRSFFMVLFCFSLSDSVSIAAQAKSTLPPNFRFCVATAAHQTEGHNIHSDWWQWEHDGRNHIKNGDTSEIATDAFHHVGEDIQNMKWLGVDTYRFSIEWAKIEPAPGQWNDEALQQYVSLLDQLRQASITPMITLYHFTFPQWVADQGGWEWTGLPEHFSRYVEHVARVIGNRADFWITLNEPTTIIAAGYISNVFPPARNDLKSILFPMQNMVRTHAKAYHTLHRLLDTPTHSIRVGLAHHLRPSVPDRSGDLLDQYITRKYDQIFNWAIPEALNDGYFSVHLPLVMDADAFIPEAIHTQDFFGLNYYTRDRVHVDPFAKDIVSLRVTEGAPVQDLGWEIYPEGIRECLEHIHDRNPQLPIWITENGIADHADTMRAPFIRDHLKQVGLAVQEGIPVEGYCHWTLNDNFEWAEGYAPKFGLFSVASDNQARTPRASAFEFKKMIEQVHSK